MERRRGKGPKEGDAGHIGNVFGICVETGYDLPSGAPGRKFTGRCVFRGNEAKDEYSDYAIFNELGSHPATIEAAKAIDAFGAFP